MSARTIDNPALKCFARRTHGRLQGDAPKRPVRLGSVSVERGRERHSNGFGWFLSRRQARWQSAGLVPARLALDMAGGKLGPHRRRLPPLGSCECADELHRWCEPSSWAQCRMGARLRAASSAYQTYLTSTPHRAHGLSLSPCFPIPLSDPINALRKEHPWNPPKGLLYRSSGVAIRCDTRVVA
jgi:hypothetical protein